MQKTFATGIDAAETVATEHGVGMADLRQIAASSLAETWPDGEGIGSSDISHHLAYLGNHEIGYLREQVAEVAERNRLVREIAESMGTTEAVAIERMRAFFAPA